MQKLALKNFEFHIGSNIWSTAQDLAHAGAVRSLAEVEKNFWVARVADGDFVYEAEVIITPGKIKAFACECWSEQRRLMCPHIAASLLKVRQFLEQKSLEKAQKEAQQQPVAITKIQVQEVLAHVEPLALNEFVQMYARRDRDFALALKTWFASTITGTENPYLLVLDASIPRYAADKKLNEADFKRLYRCCDDLATQLSLAVKQGNIQTEYLIRTALLKKIAPLHQVQPEVRAELLSGIVQTHLTGLQQLYHEATTAPEMKDKICTSLLGCWVEQRFPSSCKQGLLYFLSETARVQRNFDAIQDLFFASSSAEVPYHILELYVAALVSRDMSEAILRLLAPYFPPVAQGEGIGWVRNILLMLFYLRYDSGVLVLAEHTLAQTGLSAAFRRETEDMLLQSAQRQGDIVLQKKWLRHRFLQTGYANLLQQLKVLSAADWPLMLEDLIRELKETGQTGRIILLLAAEKQYDVLEAYLVASGDLSLVLQYAAELRREFVGDYCTKVLGDYLDTHFGLPGLQYVCAALVVLSGKIEKKHLLAIARSLEQRFPDREGLSEELKSVTQPALKSWS